MSGADRKADGGLEERRTSSLSGWCVAYAWKETDEALPLSVVTSGSKTWSSDMCQAGKVLDGISLYAKPGQKIAFVGSTGAGKTTIINLINRFYEIEGGRILYDGIDIRRIRKDDL